MDTQSKKLFCLDIFNAGKNSRFWKAKEGKVNLYTLAEHVNISDWTIRYWYAQWENNHNTDLNYVKLNKDELDKNKARYFHDLANGVKLTQFQYMAKYHIHSMIFKAWNKEYSQQTQDITPGNDRDNCDVHIKLADDPIMVATKIPEVKEPVEIVDGFFAKLTTYVTELQEAKRQRDYYKEKCEKWSKQVLDLQNALLHKE